MIDSVLKGTGNSRFLKSAVPAGTSWADALAMLQAGTFPIDFNGINTEGFQQVGTPLNKANLLKDATAAQIGLPPSTTPDGMFQALGNTGELHVWRKTVTTAQEIPAKYELGELQTGSFQFVGSSFVTWEYGTPNVGDDGTVFLVSSGSSNVDYSSNLNDLRGKYCKPNQASGIFLANQVIFIPSDAVFTQSGSAKYVSKYQQVIGTPKVPAGTTTTYPVSTNPNAYQEGDDAKEAGYTLGEVVIGETTISHDYNASFILYGPSIKVSDNGTISIVDGVNEQAGSAGIPPSWSTRYSNKFIQCHGETNSVLTNYGQIMYIPSDGKVRYGTDNTGQPGIIIDRYQPVTGYAAIPAGTTIEYLGKLGDKARVQVLSYVGTGTYGSSNQNSLTFPRKPHFIMVPGAPFGYAYIPKGNFYYATTGDYITLESLHCVWNDDTNTMTWYHPSYPYRQYNESGKKYTFVAMY